MHRRRATKLTLLLRSAHGGARLGRRGPGLSPELRVTEVSATCLPPRRAAMSVAASPGGHYATSVPTFSGRYASKGLGITAGGGTLTLYITTFLAVGPSQSWTP